jgi:hypothetical protein
MTLINKYLTHLNEFPDLYRSGSGQGRGMGQRGGSDRVPSPVAAYEMVYGKKAPTGMRGQYPGNIEHKSWKGLSIDIHIENKWLNDLSSIKEIEMRASCEGHDKDWVSFIVFRVMPNKDSDTKYLDKIKNSLNHGVTKCDYKIGQQGRPRFIVASKSWYGQPGWEKWWNTLAFRVKNAVR